MARYSNPIIQYSDGNGVPLPGATLDFFEPGTTTRKNTFSDSSLAPASANANPVVADSAGVMPDIWLDGTYAVVLKNAGGSVQPEGTKDPIGDTTSGQVEEWLNDNTYNIPDLVKGSDNKFYRSLTDGNQGNDPTSSASNWENIEFERIYNAFVTYALGDRSIGSDGMLYFSLIASNLNNNPVSSTNWRAADQPRSADAVGTSNVITASFIPAIDSLKNGLEVRVRAFLANTSTTPTIEYESLGAKTIVKKGNQALELGDIARLGHELQLVYNSTNDTVELLNPASTLVTAFTESFVSSGQTITSAGTLNLAHGLSGKPYGISLSLVNTIAEAGYSPGDTLYGDFFIDLGGASGNGTATLGGAVSIFIKFGTATFVFRGLNLTTGSASALTNANWNIIVRAWI